MNLRKSLLPPIDGMAYTDASSQAALQALASAGRELDSGLPQAPAEALTPASAVSVTESDLSSAFRPTEAQVRVKAKFWRKWAEQPLLNAQTPTAALVASITGSGAVKGWWARSGFPDWFLNTTVSDERVEYLLHLALSAAEDILLNDDPKGAGARVAMIKTVAEMAGKLGTKVPASGKGTEDGRRRAIEGLDREGLIKLLESAGLRVERVLSLPPQPQQPEGN